MRIAFIAASHIPSLTANSMRVMKVCQSFAELGHDVHLWTPRVAATFDWGSARRQYGLRRTFPITFVRGWSALRRWDVSLFAAARASAWGADLFYVYPYQAAALLSWMGRPTVLEVHDRPSGVAGPRLFRTFLRGRGARRVLPITESLRQTLEHEYGERLRPPFAVVLPSGVDLAAYQGVPPALEARAALSLPEAFTVSYAGHLYPGRGIELMAELARRNPDISFVWAGGRPEHAAEWVARLEAQGVSNVRLLGFVPNAELPMVHAASDVLLMPYARRIAVSSGGDTAAFASPMKAFEYMAAGRAILASDLPVFGEILNSNNAVLLPPEDVDAWNAALRSIRTDDARRRDLGARARQDAARYDWKRRAEKAIDGLVPAAS